ncbi:DUF2059 domain-containing protein [Herbaspirillum sp. HC18]|nr:DUF2059 domain-containing protein [Herbaspirillum sp. HC18]
MRPLRHILFLLLLLTALAAQAQTLPAPAHLAAVKRMLTALSAADLILEGARKGVSEIRGTSPERAEALSKWLDNVSSEAVTNRIAPIYARYLSREDAEALAGFYDSATGRKVVAFYKREAVSERKMTIKDANLTLAEQGALTTFSHSRAMQNFTAARPKLDEEVKRELTGWWREAGIANPVSRYAQQLADAIERQSGNEVSGVTANNDRSGAQAGPEAVYLDQFMRLAEDGGRRMMALRKQFDADVAKLELATVLLPANLVSKDGIEAGRQRLSQFEDRLEAQLSAVTREQDSLHASLKAIDGPPLLREKVMEGFEKGLSSTYNWYIRFGENQRMLLDVFRRILSLADSRLGKISVDGQNLIFNDSADLAIYRSLRAQLATEAQHEQQLVKEWDERRQQTVRQLRGL